MDAAHTAERDYQQWGMSFSLADSLIDPATIDALLFSNVHQAPGFALTGTPWPGAQIGAVHFRNDNERGEAVIIAWFSSDIGNLPFWIYRIGALYSTGSYAMNSLLFSENQHEAQLNVIANPEPGSMVLVCIGLLYLVVKVPLVYGSPAAWMRK